MSFPKISLLFFILFCLGLVNIHSAFSDVYPSNPPNPQVTSLDNSSSQDTLTISTDKPSYTDGDKIIVSGQVGQAISGFPVVIRIQTPNGNLLSTQQVTVSPDGIFSTVINAGGNSWTQEGTYTIFAQYGVKNISAQATFDFKKSIPLSPEQSQPTIEQSQSPASQIPQETSPEPQLKIDFSGNILYVIIGGTIAVISGIAIYFVNKSKKSDTVSTEIPPQFGRGDANRIIELKGKSVYVDITVQHPDRRSSSSWNYGTDRKIGSGPGGGYLLSINLKKRDKSLMTEIVDIIEKYGFNSLLVNFQNHKSFKSSQDVSTAKAMILLDEICYDLETKYDSNKSTKAYSSSNDGVEDHASKGSPIHEQHTKTPNAGPVPESYIPNEPQKVNPKHTIEAGIPIKQTPTSITLHSSSNPSIPNQPIIITAKIFPSSVTGTVTFIIDGKTHSSITISDGAATLTISSLSIGTHTINATYSGDIKHEISRSLQITQIIQQPKPESQPDNNSFDPYLILGLNKTCSCTELKARYRELITKPENALGGMLNMSAKEVDRRTKIRSDINRARDMIRDEKNCPK